MILIELINPVKEQQETARRELARLRQQFVEFPHQVSARKWYVKFFFKCMGTETSHTVRNVVLTNAFKIHEFCAKLKTYSTYIVDLSETFYYVH